MASPAAPATIVVLGDSLSAEYGLPRNSGWVALLAARLAKDSPQYSVVNASISGDTTSGGLARLDALLREHRPAILIVELGANDGLRGLSLEAMRGNLQAIIERSQARQARVLLVGMFLPPNFGPDFDAKFHGVFEELARRNHLAFTPFLMEGFADRLDWFQADGIHPQARAEPLMLDNVWAALRPLLRD
jgi:acyl-CoA thioesterase-1